MLLKGRQRKEYRESVIFLGVLTVWGQQQPDGVQAHSSCLRAHQYAHSVNPLVLIKSSVVWRFLLSHVLLPSLIQLTPHFWSSSSPLLHISFLPLISQVLSFHHLLWPKTFLSFSSTCWKYLLCFQEEVRRQWNNIHSSFGNLTLHFALWLFVSLLKLTDELLDSSGVIKLVSPWQQKLLL